MNIQTIRKLFLVGAVLAAFLFGAMLVDHFANGQALIIPLSVVFSILALFLLALLFLTPIMLDTREPATPSLAGTGIPIIEIEGIGPVYAERLTKGGIKTTGDLLVEPADKIRSVSKAPQSIVGRWVAMADLMRLDGIGPQEAEALARAGVTGTDDLQRRSGAAIADEVNEYLKGLKVNIVPDTFARGRLEAQTVNRWKKQVPASSSPA